MSRFLEADEADDPILSLVNLIDLFMVVIGILLIIIVRNPLNPFSSRADQRMIVKDGEELRRYEASSEMGEGQGVKAGVTYKLADGRLIYVPEAKSAAPADTSAVAP